MGINRPKAEEIVVKLRQVEVLMAQGMVRLDAMRLGSMAAMGTAGLRPCCATLAGKLMTSVLNGYGNGRGLRCQLNNQRKGGFG